MGNVKINVEMLYYEVGEFKDDEKTLRSWEELKTVMYGLVGNCYSELDNCVGYYADDMARQGFITGFEYAMKLFCINLDVIESEVYYDTGTGKEHGKQCISNKATTV